MTPAVLVRAATHDTLRTVFEVEHELEIAGGVAVIVWREDGWWIEPRTAVLVDEVAQTTPMRLRHGQAITELDVRGWRMRFLVGDRERVLDELRHVESVIDPLTGVFTRRVAYRLLARMTSGVVILADLDRLKQINDQYGMIAGDTAVKRTASRLRAQVAWPSFVARYGGEEFIIGVPGVSLADGRAFAEQLRQACEPGFDYDGFPITATISLGIAVQTSGNAALSEADEAMSQAKTQGRNRVAG